MITSLSLWILVFNNRYYHTYVILASSAMVFLALSQLGVMPTDVSLYNGTLSVSSLTTTIVIITGTLVIVFTALHIHYQSLSSDSTTLNTEWVALLMLLVIGMVSLATSTSYVAVFVSIELQSLVLYILLAININPSMRLYTSTSLVSISYLINAATASALLLYAISSTSNVMLVITLAWKLGVIPLHVWSLPILDNVHSLVASIYLTITKYGTLMAMGMVAASSTLSGVILMYIGLANLTIGNVLVLVQTRYHRIITYSSLIQVGYMLLVVSTSSSIALTYLEMYSLYTVLLLIVYVAPVYSLVYSSRQLTRLQAIIMIIALYTVAGLPFMPLFWTKLLVLLSINSQALTVALVSTLLSSLIYIRLIKYMTFYN